MVVFLTCVVHSAFLYAFKHKYQSRDALNLFGDFIGFWGFNHNLDQNLVFESYDYSEADGVVNRLATAESAFIMILYIPMDRKNIRNQQARVSRCYLGLKLHLLLNAA